MPNTSASGGYLSPVSAPQPDDAALDLVLQPAIVGISGLAQTLVRRKGQPIPGQQPDRPITWCAFAVTATTSDINPDLVHDGSADAGNGQSTEFRGEYHEVTASFYGPAARGTAAVLRDGLGITQNRDSLRAQGIAYVGMERMTFVPDFENTEFVRRVDLVFRVRRIAVRTYAIQNVLTVQGQVIADSGTAAGQTDVTSPILAGP